MGWCYDSVALFLIFSNKTFLSLTYCSWKKKKKIHRVWTAFGQSNSRSRKTKICTDMVMGSTHHPACRLCTLGWFLSLGFSWVNRQSPKSPHVGPALQLHLTWNSTILYSYLFTFFCHFSFFRFLLRFSFLGALDLIWYTHSNTCF